MLLKPGCLIRSFARALIVLSKEQNVPVPIYFCGNNYSALRCGTHRVIKRVWTEGYLI